MPKGIQDKKEKRKEEATSTSSVHGEGVRLPFLRILRFSLQIVFFILLNAGLFQLASLAFPIPVIPVLSSSAAPGVTAASALDTLQYGMSAALPLLLGVGLGVFLLSALIVGKGFCAFVCPFGFAQDLVSYIRRLAGMKEVTFQPKTAKSLLRYKYYILGLVMFVASVVGLSAVLGNRAYAAAAFGVFSDVPFAALSPADTLLAIVPQMIIQGTPWIAGWGAWLWVRMLILVITLVLSFYITRAFCKYICPVAALMGPMNKYTVIGLERNLVKCVGERCRICERKCPMDVPIFTGKDRKFSKHPECILCLVCRDACRHKAIKFSYL